MKKHLILVLAVASLTVLASCEKENGTTDTNPRITINEKMVPQTPIPESQLTKRRQLFRLQEALPASVMKLSIRLKTES